MKQPTKEDFDRLEKLFVELGDVCYLTLQIVTYVSQFSTGAMLTRKEAARFMRVSDKVFRRDVDGNIPSYPHTLSSNRSRMYKAEDLIKLREAWAKGYTALAPPPELVTDMNAFLDDLLNPKTPKEKRMSKARKPAEVFAEIMATFPKRKGRR